MTGTHNALLLGTVFLPIGCAALGLVFSRLAPIRRGLALAGALAGAACNLALLAAVLGEGIQVYQVGGWPAPNGIVLVGDLLSAVFGAMASVVIAAGVVYALGCKDKCIGYPVFLPLFLCMGAGLSGALYTGDVFTLFVFVELMVISSVILTALSDNRFGLEAAIKYLLISSLGSLFLLMGIAALYATFGTLNMADIGRALAGGARPLLAEAAAVLLVCAFLLKSAVFPFHFWQPDFHTTAPTPVSAMLSSAVVKIGVYGIIRITTLMFTAEARLIGDLLVVLGVVGVFFGGLAALRTYDAKRLLAYSTLSQIGFILVGVGWNTTAALVGALVYAVNHAFIKAALLMTTGAVSSRTQTKTARLGEIGGAGHHLPGISALYLLGGLALAGVPPLNGFISKLGLVQGGAGAGHWLAVFLVVGAGALSLLYITRAWQHIFQAAPDDDTVRLKAPDAGDQVLAPAFLVGLCVALGLFAGPLVDLAGRAAAQLADPLIYIRAVLGG
jgi:multicomponent Na+:H+ antiporter subunit D